MKPGYNQTEIGVIPEDWDIGTLKEAFPRLNAGVSVNSDERAVSDYYVLKTSAVRNGKVNTREAKPVVVSDYPRLKCPVKKGSIIISRMNTPAMVGECGYSATDATDTFLPDRLWQVEPSSPDYDFRWLNYLLNTQRYSAAIRATATGTSNSMKNIAKDQLLEIAVPKPPRPEQERIAEALSDIDELIASLEKLIAKKKAIMQGTMQELLTGKRRLPRFTGKWTSHTLGELGFFTKGSGIGRKDSNSGSISAVRYGELYTKHNVFVKQYYSHISKEVASKALRVFYGDVLFAASGETKEEIGKCAAIIDNNPVFAGGDILVFRPTCRLDPVFMGLLLNTPQVCAQRAEKGQGDAIVHIHADALESITIMLPPYEEQKVIARIIMDMDYEICSLDQCLKKGLKTKEGMMRQLLTGETRI